MDFSLQLVRTAKVEGTIVAPSGVPAQNVQLTMLPTSSGTSLAPIGPTLLNRATAGPDGKFTYTAIPPGQYTIMARATRPAGGGAGAPATRVATEDVIGFAVQGAGRGGGGGWRPRQSRHDDRPARRSERAVLGDGRRHGRRLARLRHRADAAAGHDARGPHRVQRDTWHTAGRSFPRARDARARADGRRAEHRARRAARAGGRLGQVHVSGVTPGRYRLTGSPRCRRARVRARPGR